MREQDLHWLAGLLEGEGCFSYGCSPTITLGMTDEDVVRRVAWLLGERNVRGPYQYKGNKKPVFYTNLCGDAATELMRTLRPLMGVRRQARISEILDRRALAPGKAHKRGTARITECHPGAKHYAFGLCKYCYRKRSRTKGLAS